VADPIEHGNESSGPIRGVTSFHQISDYRLFKEDFTLWRWKFCFSTKIIKL